MHRLRIGGVRPASIDPQIAAVHPAQFLQLLDERSALRPSFRITLRPAHQYADPAHLLGLLRACRERPRRRATEQRDELAALHLRGHSITSSAMARSLSGIWRPSALAAFRLITSSNLVGACTGRSAGLVPLRMRSIYPAACRDCSA